MTAKRKPRNDDGLDEHGYPRHPRELAKDAWYYETKDGLYVVAHTGATIPWDAVLGAVTRHKANS